MAVSARFWVDEILTRAYNPAHVNVTLRAAGRGDQNKAWAQATPTGTIELTVNNPVAAEWFKARQGRDVEIVFDDVSDGEDIHTTQHG